MTTIGTPRGRVTALRCVTPAQLRALTLSPGMRSIVRSPQIGRRVLERLAADADARLTLAVVDGVIVGRVSIAGSFGRWKDLPAVREIAFEVAREWRGTGLATRLLRVALADPAIEAGILLAFLLPSCWDLEHERLPRGEYQQVVAKSLGPDFRRMGTDEPEVAGQSGAALFARVGALVPAEAVVAFERARYDAPDVRSMAA